MTRQSFYSVILTFFFVLCTTTASAQETGDVVVSDDGWAAFSGFAAFSALFPVISIAGALIYQPKHPQHVCAEKPDLCRPSVGSHLLMGTTVVGVMALIVGGALLGKFVARKLELSPELGWSLAGGMTGTAVTSMLYLVIPPFEPGWLHQTLGVLTIAGGAIGTGFLFREIAMTRGHAWPEFAFTMGGLVLGLGVGSLLYTPQMNEHAFAPQLGAGLGALGVGIAASLLWGYDPANRSQSSALSFQIPLLQMQF